MTTATDVLNVARAEIGYSRWADPQAGTKYGRDYATRHGAYFGASGVPYCAMFVTWVMRQAGTEPVGGDFAYTPYGLKAGRAAGREVSKYQAAPGDYVFFDWAGDGVVDHVGIVEANNGAYLTTIEGNTSSGVQGSQSNGGGVYRRTRGFGTITACIRPDYTAAAQATTTVDEAKIDGYLGPDSITTWQRVMGTTPDGTISTPESALVLAVQKRLNERGYRDQNGNRLDEDGAGIYSNSNGKTISTKTIGALVRAAGMGTDRYFSAPSETVKWIQRQIYAGHFL